MSISLFNAWSLLAGIALLFLVIRTLDRWISRRSERVFSAWAKANRLRYSPIDRFQLAPRIRERLPHPGAADVVVRDVMYRTDEQNHLYLFTVCYRTGTVGGQTLHRMVVLTRESKERSCENLDPVSIADPDSRLRQYETLMQKFSTL